MLPRPRSTAWFNSAGSIDSPIVQNPFRMGYESTRAIGLKLAGQVPKRHIDSGAGLVRREDLDKPAVRELLFPDIESYLRGPKAAGRGPAPP